MMPSSRAASATETLIVEHGSAPLESASFWFTIARMRPLRGIDRDHRPVHIAQGVNRRLADHGIFSRSDVARGQIGLGKGVAVKRS